MRVYGAATGPVTDTEIRTIPAMTMNVIAVYQSHLGHFGIAHDIEKRALTNVADFEPVADKTGAGIYVPVVGDVKCHYAGMASVKIVSRR